MSTIADVARRAGVSITTVSRVLSPGRRPHPVNAETARRVREAAIALDFVPSALAQGLASRRSGLVGLLVPDLADPHYPLVARGAEDLARREQLALLVCNTLGDSARLADYLRVLRGRRVDAVVLSGGGSLRAEDLDALRTSRLPAVLIGRPSRPLGGAATYVAVDNVGAAHAATAHLVALGRRRIAHLGGPTWQTTMADRLQGYQAALAERSLERDAVETDGSAEDGYQQVVRWLGRPPPRRPEAVFAATDRLAVATLAAAADCRLRVPRDLAVVGFDDLALAPHLRPALSSVAQPAGQLGAVALSLVLRLLAGALPEPVVLPAQLVVRASSSA